MTDRASAVALLARLHAAQNRFYAGGADAALRDVLAPAVTWTVPGRSAIAGTYRGIDEVLGYFARRRALADATFVLTAHDVLVGEGTRIAALTDGEATVHGVATRWSTVGLYDADVACERIEACWLLPLDARAFDEIWTTGR